MSRNIPKVRKWRVNYWHEKVLLHTLVVNAPNKDFARWNAREEIMGLGNWYDIWKQCDRITVSLAKVQQ